MSNRYWLAGFFVLIFGFPATTCLAQEPTAQPILGRAEPIGVLLVATVLEESTEDDTEEDSAAQPILGPAEPIGRLILVGSEPTLTVELLDMAIFEEAPQLGPPVLVASLIPQELDECTDPRTMSPIQPVHPDEIQQRLRAATQLLAASGLAEESREILQVVSKIDRDHYQQLLLDKKEAELMALQAEVDRLRWSVGRPIYRTLSGSPYDPRPVAIPTVILPPDPAAPLPIVK